MGQGQIPLGRKMAIVDKLFCQQAYLWHEYCFKYQAWHISVMNFLESNYTIC
jgi:hypothetical protein